MACERELVDRFGGTWTDDDARSIIGFDLIDAAIVLRDRGGVDMDPHAIVEWMLDGVIARVREHVPWQPGARRLLTELNDLGVPCALVTMSWRRLADAILEELAPIHFDVVVTGDDVRDGKPHPEPYLSAARALGVDPTECVAIEDSPTGVASATAAGCVVVAVPHIVAIEPAPGRYIVDSLKSVTPADLGAYLAETPPPPEAPVRGGWDDATRRRWALVGGRRRARRGHRGGDRRRRHAQQRRGPATTSTGAARRPGVDAVLGARHRPPRPRGARRHHPPAVAVLVPHHRRRHGRGRGPDADRPGAAVPRHGPPAPGAARRLDPRRHQGGGDGRHPRRPGAAVTSRRCTREVRRRRRLRRTRHRLRAVRLRRRPRHVGGDAPELGGIRRRAVAAPARRWAHADGEHPSGLRRWPNGRQRLLGLRLRRHHAARRHHPRDGVRLLGPVRGSRPDRPAELGARGDPLDRAGVGRRVEARPRDPAVRLQLGRRHDRAVPGDRRGQHQPVAARHGRPGRRARRDAGVRRRRTTR